MKILFLINPFSASYSSSTPDIIKAVCTEKGVDFAIEETKAEGLPEQAAEAFRGYDTVICGGGDGTVHAAVEGYMLSGETGKKLGIIPAGTGNDLHRHIAGVNTFKKAPKEFIQKLISSDTVTHSIWSVGSKYFINYVSVGYDAAVSDAYRIRREQSGTPSSRAGNYIRYMLLGLKKMGYTLDKDIYLESGDYTISPRKALVISNIRSYAGGARIPYKDNDSLSCIEVNNIIGYTRLMATRMFGSVSSAFITNGVLHNNGKGILQVDGENYQLNEMPGELKIEKAADIRLLVP